MEERKGKTLLYARCMLDHMRDSGLAFPRRGERRRRAQLDLVQNALVDPQAAR